jgi:hypothetical protein
MAGPGVAVELQGANVLFSLLAAHGSVQFKHTATELVLEQAATAQRRPRHTPE